MTEIDARYECEFLGFLFTSPEAIDGVLTVLDVADFAEPRCRWVWARVLELTAKKAPVDYLAVSALAGADVDQQRKVAAWIMTLTDGVPRIKSLMWHAERIRKRAGLRLRAAGLARIAETSARLVAEGDDDASAVDGAMTDLQAQLVGRMRVENDAVAFAGLTTEVRAWLDRFGRSDSDVVPTGLYRVDRLLGGGLHRGRLHTVGATTGGGKTTIVHQWACVAASKGFQVLFFSLEMEPLDLFVRQVERESRISRYDLLNEWRSTARNAQDVAIDALAAQGNQVAVVYAPSITLAGIRARCVRHAMENDGRLDLVVVDHAQIVAADPGEKKYLPEYMRMKGVAEGLRELAIRMEFAIVVAAQLNPTPKGDTASKDRMRQGQEFPNASDAVLLIHHEWSEEADGTRRPSITKILFAKNRFGAEGSYEVGYSGRTSSFYDTPADRAERVTYEAGFEPEPRAPEPAQTSIPDFETPKEQP